MEKCFLRPRIVNFHRLGHRSKSSEQFFHQISILQRENKPDDGNGFIPSKRRTGAADLMRAVSDLSVHHRSKGIRKAPTRSAPRLSLDRRIRDVQHTGDGNREIESVSEFGFGENEGGVDLFNAWSEYRQETMETTGAYPVQNFKEWKRDQIKQMAATAKAEARDLVSAQPARRRLDKIELLLADPEAEKEGVDIPLPLPFEPVLMPVINYAGLSEEQLLEKQHAFMTADTATDGEEQREAWLASPPRIYEKFPDIVAYIRAKDSYGCETEEDTDPLGSEDHPFSTMPVKKFAKRPFEHISGPSLRPRLEKLRDAILKQQQARQANELAAIPHEMNTVIKNENRGRRAEDLGKSVDYHPEESETSPPNASRIGVAPTGQGGMGVLVEDGLRYIGNREDHEWRDRKELATKLCRGEFVKFLSVTEKRDVLKLAEEMEYKAEAPFEIRVGFEPPDEGSKRDMVQRLVTGQFGFLNDDKLANKVLENVARITSGNHTYAAGKRNMLLENVKRLLPKHSGGTRNRTSKDG